MWEMWDDELSCEVGSKYGWYSEYRNCLPEYFTSTKLDDCSGQCNRSYDHETVVGCKYDIDMEEIREYRDGEDRTTSADESDHRSHEQEENICCEYHMDYAR